MLSLILIFSFKNIQICRVNSQSPYNFLISVTENYKDEDDLQERFSYIWLVIIHWATENPNEFLFIQQFGNSPYFRQLKMDQKARYEKFFREIFEEGKFKNIFKDLSVDLLMQISLAQINGLIYCILDHPAILEDTIQMRIVFESIWDSLQK